MLPFISVKRVPGWMAIVPKAGRVDLAYAIRPTNGGRPLLKRLDSFQMTDGIGGALQRLRVSCKLGAHRCSTLLGAGEYHLAQMEAPAVPAAERAEALRWRFKDMVDFSVDAASIGVLDIPVDGVGNRQAMVYAVAASDAVVAARMSAFDAARVPLDAIDIPELAQRNVAALFEEPNRGLAFLHIDETGGLLTITFRGELYAVRRVELSATQIADADEERRQQLLERVMLELQRTLDNFDRQYSFISVAGLMVASCPVVAELVPYLAENLYIPVKTMDLSEVCDFPDLPELRDPLRQGQCLAAIGAALRTEGAA